MTNSPADRYSFFQILTIAFAVPFMVLGAIPYTFFAGNVQEIPFGITDVLLPAAGIVLLVSAFLTLVLWLTRKLPRLFAVLAGLLVGVALAAWVQGQLLTGNFGLFDGRDIAWGHYIPQMIMGLALWIILLVVTMYGFINRYRKFTGSLVMAVYLLGSLSVGVSVVTAKPSVKEKMELSEYRDLFDFHPRQNSLLIILDAFQSDYFHLISKDYPDEIAEFEGFTFYRNTISRYPSTMGSLPSIMTGAVYRNEEPYPYFIDETRKKFGLLKAFRNRSYLAHMVGLEGTYPVSMPMKRIVDKIGVNHTSPVFEYLDYGLFRASPVVLKPVIFNHGNWFLAFLMRNDYAPGDHGIDVRFLELVEQRSAVKNMKEQGTFKIMHFCYPHPPFNMDENLEFTPGLEGEEGYIRQARGAVKLASRILSRLKVLGIYDQSEIIIMSDHGTWEILPREQFATNSKELLMLPRKVVSSSHALLLHKPAGSSGPLVTSDAPLETTDISCIFGFDNPNNDCRGYHQAMAGEPRERRFYFYEWVVDDYTRQYLPDITEYIINGPVYIRTSYKKGGSFPAPKNKQEALQRSHFRVLREIPFDKQNEKELKKVLKEGWSFQEATHRWTLGPEASLSVRLQKEPENDIYLRLSGYGYYDTSRKEFQRVTVIVNKEEVTSWELTHEGDYFVSVDKDLVKDGVLDIVFRMANPRNPATSEGGRDLRPIGLKVTKLVIEERD